MHVARGVRGAERLERGQDVLGANEVEEDEVDSAGQGTVGGEGGVGLHIVGLWVGGDLRVEGVIAVGAEVVWMWRQGGKLLVVDRLFFMM